METLSVMRISTLSAKQDSSENMIMGLKWSAYRPNKSGFLTSRHPPCLDLPFWKESFPSELIRIAKENRPSEFQRGG
jgi:hypothetical protein